jgi:4-hydroxy-2-oxoheptanedioate aldolase
VTAGAGYVVIDHEHSSTGHKALHVMIATTQGTDCMPLVWIAEFLAAYVK